MGKKVIKFLIGLLLISLLSGSFSPTYIHKQAEAYVEPGLALSSSGHLSVIVTAGSSAQAARAVSIVGGRVSSDLWLIDAVAARIPIEKLDDLADTVGVISIVNNKTVGTATPRCDDDEIYEHGPCARRPGWVTDKLEIKFETQAPAKVTAPVVQLPNGKFVVVLESNYVAFVDRNANIETLLELSYKKSQTAPLVAPDGSVYFTGEDAQNSSKVVVFALNSDGGLRWSYSQKDLVNGGIALSPGGETVYAAHTKAKIFVLDAASGEKLFEMKPDMEKPGLVNSAPLVQDDGTVYLQSTGKEPDKSDRRGNLVAIDPAQSVMDDKHILWRFEAIDGSDLMTLDFAPVFVNGQIYAFNDSNKTLFAINRYTGSLLFRVELPDKIAIQPVVGQDGAVFILTDHTIFSVNADGNTRFNLPLNAGAFQPVFSANRATLYVGEGNLLYALNTLDGSIRWEIILDGSLTGIPDVLPNNDIALGTRDSDRLYVVTDDGSIITNIKLEKDFSQAISLDNAENKLLVRYGDKGILMLGDLPAVWDGRLDVEPTEIKLEWRLSNPINLDIGVDQVHNTRTLDGSAITGEGVTIAVVDSGVYYSNKVKDILGSGLDQHFIGQVEFTRAGICLNGGDQYDTYCYVDKDKSMDHYGHGSHVAGIIWSQILDYATGVNMSIAPGANILSVRVLGEGGTGSYEDVIEGVQYVVANKDQFNIRVMNLSLSAEVTTPYFADPLNRAVEAAWENGIVVIAAAGNTGPGANTITVPGNDPYVITVGALDNGRTPGYWADDVIPSWSSSGPTNDGFIKPDILAPGRNIISFMYNNPNEPGKTAKLAQDHPDYSQSISLFRMNGTSMATGVVSGVAALILQMNPDLTPDQVKFRLVTTALQLTDEQGQLAFNIFEQGAGRIWAPAAVLNDFPADGNANAGMDIQNDLNHGWGYYDENGQAVIDPHEIIHHYQGPVQKTLSGDGTTYLFYVITAEGTAIALSAADAETGEWLDAFALQARALASPTGNLVWSGGNLVWSGGELFDGSGNLVWSGGELIIDDGRLLDTSGNLFWSGGDLFDASGRMVWSGGNLVWSGGHMVWSGGRMVWSGGELFDSAGNLVWSGGNLVWSGGELLDSSGRMVWSGGELFDASGHMVWSGGNLVWSGGNLVWSGGNLIWSGGNLVWSGGNLVWSGGNLVWSGGELFDSAGNLVWSGGNLVWSGGELFNTSGNLVWSGGDLFDASGRMVWSGGNLVWSGGHMVWSGGRMVWSGGELFDSADRMVWSGGNLVWSGGNLMDTAGNLVWSGGELFDAAGNLVWSGGNLVWSGGRMVWSGGRMVWSGGNLFDAAGNLVWSGGNLVWSGSQLFDIAGNLVWSGGELFDASGRMVWSGGRMVWSGGHMVWSGGRMVWSGGNLVWSGGRMVWSGGRMVWSGGSAQSPMLSTTYWVNDDGSIIAPTLDVSTSFHIADLDGYAIPLESKWKAKATVTIYDNNNNPVEGVEVEGIWSFGHEAECTTDVSGRCSVLSKDYEADAIGILSFTVMDAEHEVEQVPLQYEPAENTDPDYDSDSETISVDRPVPISMYISDLDGENITQANKWRTSVTFSVLDANLSPVTGARVYGAWSYGSGANCITLENGQCSLLSNSVDGYVVDTIGFTVNAITHDEILIWDYEATANSDEELDSDGTTITMDRPVPTSIYVSDLDETTQYNATKWWTTVSIAVKSADGLGVSGATVNGHWSYDPGRSVNCETDELGICSLTSIQLIGSYTSATFVVDDITHSEVLEFTYNSLGNNDPDEDSDGNSIQITRPEAVGIFVADMDGLNSTSGDKWRTTITFLVLDENLYPVEDAKLYGYWSYKPDSLLNCETDEAGMCSLLSSEFEGQDRGEIGFIVENITHPAPISFAYAAGMNRDPDGDSDGTSLMMERPVPTPISITDLDGENLPNGSKWQTRVSMTVRDVNGQPVGSAKVFGNWSYGSSANCTTDQDGQCSLLSSSFEGESMAAISFTITDITTAELLVWVYDPESNADPDEDSNGTTLIMERPAPNAIYVADLDGESLPDGNEWRAKVTVTVMDEMGNPIEDAKVYFVWSTGSTGNCTTDENGQCTVISGKMKASEVNAIEFSIDNITHEETLVYAYDPAFNNDPDGDSDGTVINISKP